MDKFMVQFGEKDIGKLLDLFQGSAEKNRILPIAPSCINLTPLAGAFNIYFHTKDPPQLLPLTFCW
jgi:hypothetical protein